MIDVSIAHLYKKVQKISLFVGMFVGVDQQHEYYAK